jgi:hypothetical protein
MRIGVAAASVILLTASCAGSSGRASPPTTSIGRVTTTTATTDTRTALVEVSGELAAFAPPDGEPSWTLPGAVASPDGTTAYRVEAGAVLARFDTRDASSTGRWPLPENGAWRVVVVSPDGSHVVLTDGTIDSEHRPAVTRLALWSGGAPNDARLIERPGALQPEALSPNGRVIFLLDYRGTYYRVRSLDVVTGEISDTFGRDKSPAEDMNGTAVHAALSPDGHVLSTLYRIADETTGEPFVHVLNLAAGWSYCADLPEGTYTAITSSVDGHMVYVGADDGSWIAIDVAGMDEASADPLPMTFHPPSSPPVPLAAGGSLVTSDGAVTADAAGLSWYQGGTLLAHIAHPVDRLVALAPD